MKASKQIVKEDKYVTKPLIFDHYSLSAAANQRSTLPLFNVPNFFSYSELHTSHLPCRIVSELNWPNTIKNLEPIFQFYTVPVDISQGTSS